MANWKKVIVSGSQASLLGLSGSLLTDGKLLFAQGDVGAITSAANISVNAAGDLVANITGSLNGNADTATALSNSLVDGFGIADFTFDGSSEVSIAVKAIDSISANIQPVSVTGDGVGFNVDLIDGTGLSAAAGVLNVSGLTTAEFSAAALIDEDDLSSNSATRLPSQQSVKAYVDSQVTAQDL